MSTVPPSTNNLAKPNKSLSLTKSIELSLDQTSIYIFFLHWKYQNFYNLNIEGIIFVSSISSLAHKYTTNIKLLWNNENMQSLITQPFFMKLDIKNLHQKKIKFANKKRGVVNFFSFKLF